MSFMGGGYSYNSLCFEFAVYSNAGLYNKTAAKVQFLEHSVTHSHSKTAAVCGNHCLILNRASYLGVAYLNRADCVYGGTFTACNFYLHVIKLLLLISPVH